MTDASPHSTRPLYSRWQVEDAIEMLIELRDALDPDPDLEDEPDKAVDDDPCDTYDQDLELEDYQ